MKIGKYIIGLLSGLTFGMLFAPKKGSELRQEIIRKSARGGSGEGLKALGNAFVGAGGDAWTEVKKLSEHEQVEAFLEVSKEKLQEYLATVEEKGMDVAAVAQKKLEEIAELATRKAHEYREKLVHEPHAPKKEPKKVHHH